LHDFGLHVITAAASQRLADGSLLADQTKATPEMPMLALLHCEHGRPSVLEWRPDALKLAVIQEQTNTLLSTDRF